MSLIRAGVDTESPYGFTCICVCLYVRVCTCVRMPAGGPTWTCTSQFFPFTMWEQLRSSSLVTSPLACYTPSPDTNFSLARYSGMCLQNDIIFKSIMTFSFCNFWNRFSSISGSPTSQTWYLVKDDPQLLSHSLYLFCLILHTCLHSGRGTVGKPFLQPTVRFFIPKVLEHWGTNLLCRKQGKLAYTSRRIYLQQFGNSNRKTDSTY